MQITILTGAGISAESGIATFRDPNGIWARHDPMDLATPEGFARDPDRVHAFYNDRRANARGAQPNAAHFALARLERALPGRVTLITQNIDDLHERAGSRAVLHMHGTLEGARCAACDHHFAAPLVMATQDPCPACGKPATRPDIVWFGEMPFFLDESAELLDTADIFAVIGSSATVWPAAGFVDRARDAGAQTVELNLEPSARYGAFESHHPGRASLSVPLWVEALLASHPG